MREFIIAIILVQTIWLDSLSAQMSDIYMPLDIQNAYLKSTRSNDGNPGRDYWQNHADYRIDVRFNPATRMLSGNETIQYFNNSPDSLKRILLHLFPNILKKDNYRDYPADMNDLIDGVAIESIVINGAALDTSGEAKNLEYTETNCWINLPDALPAGDKISIDISWNFKVNQNSHYREGGIDSTSFFIAYFFPRVAVYDDIDGWNEFLYLGLSEFYNDFGSYDVKVTVPGGFLVRATGEWQNPAEILKNPWLDRYNQSLQNEVITHIIDSTEFTFENISKNSDFNTFHFKAQDVPDFAFGLSDHYLWDGSKLVVDKQSGQSVYVDAVYTRSAKDFYEVADIARKAISYMSEKLPGIAFPYPKLTVFNGLGNMEYPMMVNDQAYDDINRTVKLTIHEILHTYMPFYCGINESKYGWMDEGWATFGHFVITSDMIGEEHAEFYFMPGYQEHKGFAQDMPLFALSDYLKRPVYHDNTYVKAASFYLVLKNWLGDDMFINCLQTFMKRWKSKHPTPYDFFNTFQEVSKKDLSWLIRPWFFEYGYADLALQKTDQPDAVIVLRKGSYPVPISLKLIYDDGTENIVQQSAAVWQDGKTKLSVKVDSPGRLSSAELIDISRIDADLSNNILEFKK